YTYPDVAVACSPQFADENQTILLNPVLIVQVSSPSTQGYDQSEKFHHYRTISSLREYLLVSSKRIDVELRRRGPDATWTMRFADRLEDAIELESVGCRLALSDIYKRARLEPLEPKAPVE